MLWIRTVSYSHNARLISLPTKAVKDRGWENEQYLLVDDRDPEILIIRRPNFGEKEPIRKSGSAHYVNRRT